MNNQATDNLETEELQQVDNSHWSNQKLALDRLEEKNFFKTLVQDGYFKEYVMSLVMELVDRNSTMSRATVMEKLVGVANLQMYFDTVTALSLTEEDFYKEVSVKDEKYTKQLLNSADAINEAANDVDFKTLMESGFLDVHMKNQTSLLSNNTIINAGHRTEVLEALSGISTFMNYIVDIKKDVSNIDDGYEDEVED